ncbi:hypothetical protein BJ912DRAFT_955885 [Pholiota molesta]|nr:hypothetical protein BJ912DRAFT_955885 [Pholiota molesta]
MRLLIQIPCFEDPVSAAINRICDLWRSHRKYIRCLRGLTALIAYVSCMGRVPSCVGAIEHVNQPIVPPSPSSTSQTYDTALIGACTAENPANETKPASPQCGSPSAHQRPQNPHAQQDGRGATRQLPARCIRARRTSATKETPGGANWPQPSLSDLGSPKAGPRPWVWFLEGSYSATRKKRNGNR